MKLLVMYLPHGLKPDLAVSFYGFPSGVAYITGALQQAGHTCEIMDLHLHVWTHPSLQARLKTLIPKVDAVLIGGMITTFPHMQWISEEMKKIRPDVPIVVGGSSATSSPEIILKHSKVDYCILGEGEVTVVEFVKWLENGGDISKVRGIAYRDGDKVVLTEPRPRIDDLDASPWPAYGTWLADEYIHRTGVLHNMVMHTSRGCPNSCRYCYRIFGHKVRYRSADSIIEEIRYLNKDFGVRCITFEDDDFFRNRKRLIEFCEKLIRTRMKLIWKCCARVDSIDDETLKVAKRSGILGIQFGFESGSDEVLQSMGKRATAADNERAVKLVKKYFIGVETNFIFGWPNETVKTIFETRDFCVRNNMGIRGFWLTPYPGTWIYRKLLEEGVIKDELEHILHISKVGCFGKYPNNYTKLSDLEFVDAVMTAKGEANFHFYENFLKATMVAMEEDGRL